MTDREALWMAVCSDPTDDTPRLILADWLDEHGQPERAEFIRVQCELARKYPPSIDDRLQCLKPLRAGLGTPAHGLPKGLPVAVCGKCEVCVEMKTLRDKERLLLNHGPEWSRSLSEACQWTCAREIYDCFRRGFVNSIKIPAADWLAHADRLYWHPKQKCRECEGNRGFDAGGSFWVCNECDGVGFRPFPTDPLPHPITEVRLTTPIAAGYYEVLISGNITDNVFKAMARRWPTITFPDARIG